MLYVKPVPDVDILFTFVTVYLSVFSLIFLLSTSFWWNKVIYINHLPTKHILSDSRVTNISKGFTHKTVVKTSWHRNGTKLGLRHCHPMYTQSAYQSKSVPGSFFGSRQLKPDDCNGTSCNQGLCKPHARNIAVFMSHEVASGQRDVLWQTAGLVGGVGVHVRFHVYWMPIWRRSFRVKVCFCTQSNRKMKDEFVCRVVCKRVHAKL